MDPINLAIQICGSQSALAKKLGVMPQVVNNWMRRGNVPIERCIDIERATAGKVTCESLRPDLADRWAYLRGTNPNPPSTDTASLTECGAVDPRQGDRRSPDKRKRIDRRAGG